MTLGSKTENDKRIYSLHMTESEFKSLQAGTTLNKPVEWVEGRGVFQLKYIRK